MTGVRAMKSKSFDAANFLETNDDIQEFLAQAASTGDTKHLSHCLNIAIRARGAKGIVKTAHETAEGLHQADCIDRAKLSEYEKLILEAYENNELQSTNNFQEEVLQAKSAARNTLNNKAKISTSDK